VNTLRFEHLFHMGMDRGLPELLSPAPGLSIGLGESPDATKRHGRDLSLGLPDWEWPRDRIPVEDETVGIVHAYHFFEHLSGEDAIEMLFEIDRVLVMGGVLQFCIPWGKSELAIQDLTHKSLWSESSFRNLFNTYYDPKLGRELRLRQHYLVIAGIVERNLALLGQLVKERS